MSPPDSKNVRSLAEAVFYTRDAAENRKSDRKQPRSDDDSMVSRL